MLYRLLHWFVRYDPQGPVAGAHYQPDLLSRRLRDVSNALRVVHEDGGTESVMVAEGRDDVQTGLDARPLIAGVVGYTVDHRLTGLADPDVDLLFEQPEPSVLESAVDAVSKEPHLREDELIQQV